MKRPSAGDVLAAAVLAADLVGYASTLRLTAEGVFRTPLAATNPPLAWALAAASAALLPRVTGWLEPSAVPDLLAGEVRRDLWYLPPTIALMLPGTGVGLGLLSAVGAPAPLGHLALGWTYVLLPVLYSVNLRGRGFADLGFLDPGMLPRDLAVAFASALLGVTAIEPVNFHLARAVGQLSSAPPSPIPLSSIPLFLASGAGAMCQNVAWSGFIQARIQRALGWNWRGLLVYLSVMIPLLLLYFEPHASLQSLIAFGPGAALGMAVDALTYHRSRRIAPPALWHWIANSLGTLPVG